MWVCGALAHACVGVGPGCSKLGTLRQTLIPSAELFPQTRALSKLLLASSVLTVLNALLAAFSYLTWWYLWNLCCCLSRGLESLCVLLILKFLDMENVLCTSDISTETHWWLSATGRIFTFFYLWKLNRTPILNLCSNAMFTFPKWLNWYFLHSPLRSWSSCRDSRFFHKIYQLLLGYSKIIWSLYYFSFENCFNLITHSNSRG